MAKDDFSPDETIDSTEPEKIIKDEPHHSVHHKHHKHHASHEAHAHKESAPINMWMIASIVLFVLAVLFLTLWLTKSGSGAAVSEDKIAEEMKSFIDANLLQPGITSTIESVTESEAGVYEVIVNVQGQKITSYASKDGTIFFPSGMVIDETLPPPTTGTQTAAPTEIPKTDKPVVQIFVMSECPFGVQAEEAFMPAVKLLGDSIDYQIRFIANQNPDGTFSSLHGQPEVDENLRQVCAAELYPDTYLDYIGCQNKNYMANVDMATTWQTCATTSGMDSAKLNTCATGTQGKTLLAENAKVASDLQIGSSPTVLINGVKYTGARTAQAFQQTVCTGFNDAPEACGTVVEGTAPAAAGNC